MRLTPDIQLVIAARILTWNKLSEEATLPRPNLRPAFNQTSTQEIANRLYLQTHTSPFRNRGSNSGKRDKK